MNSALEPRCCFAVPRSVREALTSWDRNLYGLPKALTETKSRIYEKIYHLGTDLVTTCFPSSPSQLHMNLPPES